MKEEDKGQSYDLVCAVRLNTELKMKLEEYARDTGCGLSTLIRRYAIEGLRRDKMRDAVDRMSIEGGGS